MCGRFVSIIKENKLKKIFNISKVNNLVKDSYNIAPSQNVNLIFKYSNELILDSMKWGYSFFNKQTNNQQHVINSRIETINEKILFKDSFLKRRCIVIANGYYEWKKINNNKIPFLISIPVLETIFFAAIWRVENINNNRVPVCCILTKEASDRIKSIHGRMPIIYSANDALTFLKEKETKTENSNLENDLDYYTVSKKINNPQNNSIDCVEYFKYSY